jgi:2-polyprenyl-3-methyl-5-hydroxy-6-metoxy-1,4-benzoquinol methylase
MTNTMIKNCPNFEKILYIISKKSPMHRNTLAGHFSQRDEKFWKRAETFSKGFFEYLKNENSTIDEAVDAYLEMCQIMLKEQIKFQRTGTYSCANATEANEHVYSSEKKMMNYMRGLALSTYLWPNHYLMYDFYFTGLGKLNNVFKCLEIGIGHAVYFIESLRQFPKARFKALDISPASLKMAAAMIAAFVPKAVYELKETDVATFNEGTYDYIVMGEVLEHVDNPKELLRKIHSLLNKNGHFYVTTCANAPAVDHVYLYDSVGHIRREIEECGYKIDADLALAVDGSDKSKWIKVKTEINYAAFLSKKP